LIRLREFFGMDQFQDFFHVKSPGVSDFESGKISLGGELVNRRLRELEIMTHFFGRHDVHTFLLALDNDELQFAEDAHRLR
jgi:hypothetical protein